jgi:hypothetical protein
MVSTLRRLRPGMVAHACNSNTQETEAGVPQIPGLLGLNRVPGQPEKDGGAERR